MKKNCIIDYLGCILVRFFGFLFRLLPVAIIFQIGKFIGWVFYHLDIRHRRIVYINLKKALSKKFSSQQISAITRNFYLNFGQNLIEIFILPKIDNKYMKKYIQVEGKENITQAFQKANGVIFLAVHAGGWELANVTCANLGFPLNFLAREQGFKRLDSLLNSYRQQKNCKVIQRDSQTRHLVEALKNNEAVGMTIDQGGKTGEQIKFFGYSASMATGAIRLALKYNAQVLPCFYTRLNGPYNKVIIAPVFELKKTGDRQIDIRENLQALAYVFEDFISRYPQEYLWRYKIWKYGREKNILILSDGKTGHLRQSQALAKIISETAINKDIKANIDIVEVEFKNKISRHFLTLFSLLAGKIGSCHGYLKKFLQSSTYQALEKINPDIVISCGSSLAAINLIFSKENLAKSIVLMRPSVLSVKRFDLVIMPEHDRPKKSKNTLITRGALNLIDQAYLRDESQKLLNALNFKSGGVDFTLGLLIGGNTRDFILSNDLIEKIIGQIKSVGIKNKFDLLVSTSRRTPKPIEGLIKEEFARYPLCKALFIANEENPAFAVGGILGLSEIIICSPESISMISEAVNSGKYVIVFNVPGLDKKYKRFLQAFSRNNYIYFIVADELAKTIIYLWMHKPKISLLQDRA